MSPSVDDVLNCQQKYDETHQDFYQRHAEVLAAKLHATFQNIINVICTEDPNISGTDYRVDAYVETPTEKYLLETKLCMSSGATLGTAQKSRTLNKLGIQEAALTAPQQHLSTAEKPLKDYVIRAVYGRTDQNNSALAPRLGQITLAKEI